MTLGIARTQLALASLLTLSLLALTAVPAAAGGTWRARGAEDVAIRLTNCMRTGGYVTRAGKCKGWGSGRYAKALPRLERSDRLSDHVSWPWVKRSIQFYGPGRCWVGHAKNGSTVDKRFAWASLRHLVNGENMGCAMYGRAQMSVVSVVRMWQSEKTWGGPHWRQIRDLEFKSAGVGVARYGKRKTQMVMNFYGETVD